MHSYYIIYATLIAEYFAAIICCRRIIILVQFFRLQHDPAEKRSSMVQMEEIWATLNATLL